MANGDTKTNQYLDIAANGSRADLPADSCCDTRTQSLIRGVAERIMDVEDEVERLENNPDVVDIVATYADLQDYDTSGLTDKDIIRVLEDSTHDNNSTYYRWNATTNQFDFVGEISGGSVNVVQTTGTSTTDVMSQNAVTSMVFNDPSTAQNVSIGNTSAGSYAVSVGNSASGVGAYSTAVGYRASSSGNGSISIGQSAYISSGNDYSIAIGRNTKTNSKYSVALGADSQTTRQGEVFIGCENNNYGYNGTKLRVLGGVHDPVNAQDAATKAYVDANAGGVTPVQTTGTSTTDVMSQDATTKMVYPRGESYKDRIGIGLYANPNDTGAIAIGASARAWEDYGVAIGSNAFSTHNYSVALGDDAQTTRQGEVFVGCENNNHGYNNTKLRVIGGVHDGQTANDAVTVGQVNSVIDSLNSALNVNIPHIGV